MRYRFKEVEVFSVEGVKVMMMHIGGYPGRYALGVRALLAEHRPNIFISGHSHILKIMNDRHYNLLHINPGAAGKQGWQTVRTLVRLKIDNGRPVDCEVIELA